MAVELLLEQVSEQNGGNFIISVRAQRAGTGDFIGKKTVELPAGSTPDDLKDALRPALTNIIADEARREQLRALAQQALDELLAEVS